MVPEMTGILPAVETSRVQLANTTSGFYTMVINVSRLRYSADLVSAGPAYIEDVSGKSQRRCLRCRGKR